MCQNNVGFYSVGFGVSPQRGLVLVLSTSSKIEHVLAISSFFKKAASAAFFYIYFVAFFLESQVTDLEAAVFVCSDSFDKNIFFSDRIQNGEIKYRRELGEKKAKAILTEVSSLTSRRYQISVLLFKKENKKSSFFDV